MMPRTPPIHIPTPKAITTNNPDIESINSTNSRTGGARVQQCIPQWDATIHDMQAAGTHSLELQRVKVAIREGVRIEPSSDPDPVSLPNTPAVRRNIGLCSERIRYYYDIGALELLTRFSSLFT